MKKLFAFKIGIYFQTDMYCLQLYNKNNIKSSNQMNKNLWNKNTLKITNNKDFFFYNKI